MLAVRLPRRHVPDAADDRRALRARRRRPRVGSRSRPAVVGAGFLDLDGRGRRRPQRQGRLPAAPAGAARRSRRSWPRSSVVRRGAERLGVRAHRAPGPFLVVATIFTSLYPRVMVSSTDFANSLTVDGASSAHYTLAVMTVVAADRGCRSSCSTRAGRTTSSGHGSAATSPNRRPLDGGSAGEAGSPRRLGRGVRRPSPPQRARRARPPLARRRAARDARRLLVLAQVVLLARVAARSFHGASLARSRRPLALLARGRLRRARRARLGLRGRRPAGRRSVLSQLRLDLVERASAASRGSRRRRERRDRDGRGPGVDALETYFARYLPQLVLAGVVPVAVLALVAVDRPPLGAGDAADAAARPVFMWLIGALHGATARGSAGRRSAAPVDPLPRRRARAADAAGVQPGEARGERRSRTSASGIGARRWGRSASPSCPAPSSSWPRRSASRSSR